MPEPVADPPADSPRALAERVLATALADLEREARRNGRLALYRSLCGGLAGTVGPPGGEHAVALRRLRQRFRERVNAGLRRLEPDAQRRRALRRLLYAALRQPE
jgi:hypothetical protein